MSNNETDPRANGDGTLTLTAGSAEEKGPVAAERYFSYRRYLRQRFGVNVARLAIDARMCCPNRDGTIGVGGCHFCDNSGFSAAAGALGTPREQLMRAMERLRSRNAAIIAYLQPYSNTYAPLERLRDVYESLIAAPHVVGLAIGTRPDCFSTELYDYLAELARRTYVCVELGLQSSHNETLRSINRGHTFDCFIRCVEALSQRNIETVAHVILGLPGESDEMMDTTARRLAQLPVSGVKLHQLMIFRGTPFAELYAKGAIKTQDVEFYARRVARFLSLLRPDQHIHRLVAESQPARGLMAPLWSMHKQKALQIIYQMLELLDIRQGCNFNAQAFI